MWLGCERERIILGSIGQSDDDHGPCLRPEAPRLASLLRFSSKPSHVAVIARPDKLHQVLPDVRTKIGFAEANRVEPDAQSSIADLVSRVGWSSLGHRLTRTSAGQFQHPIGPWSDQPRPR